MKPALLLLLLAGFFACSSPAPITANPDDAPGTPGTVGSSKMTEQMPREPAREKSRVPDTARRRQDQPPRQQP